MKYLYLTSLFFTFFPYISFIYTGTDIQPYSFIFNFIIMIILIFYKKLKKMNPAFFLLFLPILLSFVLIIFSTNLFAGFRSLYGYLNLAVSLVIYSYIIRYHEKLFLLSLKYSIYVWVIVGVIQTFIDRKFLIFLLPRTLEQITFSETRGVTSLAPEPTFFGIVCIFLILILLTIPSNKIKNKNLLIKLLIFSIFFTAKSSMAILFCILFLLLFLFINFFKPKVVLSFMILSLLTFFILNNINIEISENYRAYKLFKLFLDNPLEIAKLDASMNDRVSAIYFSLKGFFSDFMRPHTYGEYSKLLLTEVPESNYFWYITINDRIKSYYGSILFELGFIGYIYIGVFSYFIYEFYKNNKKQLIVFILFFNLILFSAIPLSISFVPLYLASLYVNKSYNYKAQR